MIRAYRSRVDVNQKAWSNFYDAREVRTPDRAVAAFHVSTTEARVPLRGDFAHRFPFCASVIGSALLRHKNFTAFSLRD